MNKTLLALVILLPFVAGAGFFAAMMLVPGHTLVLMLGFTLFTAVECALLATLAFKLLKGGSGGRPPR
jgi:hypothetical protein